MTEQGGNWRRQKEMLVVSAPSAAGPGTAQPHQPAPLCFAAPFQCLTLKTQIYHRGR